MLAFSLRSQVQRAAHWYFGYKAGIDFSSGTAVADINSQLESIEGCSSISDPLGNLLFYSNGEKVWNKNHLLMSNGSALLGNHSSTQSSLIVPQPLSTNIYYLFTTSAASANGFRYNIIDMNLASGNGDVTASKNILLFNSSTEELAATRHCNDIDYWIIARESAQNSLKFYAYKLTGSGIAPPVVSQFFVSNPSWNVVSSLTFSQDGNLLSFSSAGTPVYLFNFNKGTGQLAMQTNIQGYANENIYSNALSPDKSKLYITSWVPFGYCYLSQFDLTASNIAGSRKNIDSVSYMGGSPNGFGFIGQVRLAPDQKIYVSRWHQKNPNTLHPGTPYSLDSLGVIGAPNLTAPACNFQRNGFYLNQQPTMIGLPNFVSNFTYTVLANPQPLPSLSLNNYTICNGDQVTLTVNPSSAANSYTWLPVNVVANTFTASPVVTTNYSVVTTINGCEMLLSNTVTVVNPPAVSVNAATVVCGTPATLIANATPNQGVTYSWLPAGSLTNTNIVSPAATSVYSVIVTLNGCNRVFSNTVTVIPTSNPVTDFLYHNSFCKNDTIIFPQIASGFNTGGVFSSSSLNIDPGTGAIDLSSAIAGTHMVNYFLAAANCFSAANSTANVIVLPSPDLFVGNNVNILPGASTTLSVTGGPSYTWSPANYLSCINCSNPVATPPDNIKYCVISQLNSCISKKCIDITVTCEIGYDHSVPNAFTPNGDGHNDAFCLQGWTDCITNFNIMIFDRWGEKVFESNDPSFCWDGVYKGRLMNAGVFVYVIKATKQKEQINKKGNITLIR